MSSENINTGWISVYRELLSKSIWLLSTPEQKTVLIALLLMANHSEHQWEFKGERYICKPGQLITSLENIRQNCGKGVTIQNIRTALSRFEKHGFLTNESTKQNRLITICNYESYQGKESKTNKASNNQLTNDQQTTNSQLTTNNNDNKVNNDNTISESDWRKSFEVYQNLVRQGYNDVTSDKEWMSKQQEYNPKIDITKSIEKSCVNFWSTKEGWANKKKGKAKTINWKTTFGNAISNPMNKVYKDNNNIAYEDTRAKQFGV